MAHQLVIEICSTKHCWGVNEQNIIIIVWIIFCVSVRIARNEGSLKETQ